MSTPPVPIRFDVDELLAYAAARAQLPVCPERGACVGGCNTGEHYWHGRLAVDLGVDKTLPQHWRTRGGLGPDSAERAANALGVTPWAIWPDTMWRLVDLVLAGMDDEDLADLDALELAS